MFYSPNLLFFVLFCFFFLKFSLKFFLHFLRNSSKYSPWCTHPLVLTAPFRNWGTSQSLWNFFPFGSYKRDIGRKIICRNRLITVSWPCPWSGWYRNSRFFSPTLPNSRNVKWVPFYLLLTKDSALVRRPNPLTTPPWSKENWRSFHLPGFLLSVAACDTHWLILFQIHSLSFPCSLFPSCLANWFLECTGRILGGERRRKVGVFIFLSLFSLSVVVHTSLPWL